MLEPHPPHATPHSWRDFFIHIITIVVGLLIAVGLEQTVEAVHHHREVVKTRADLDRDLEQNRAFAAGATAEFRRYVPILQTDLAVLRFLQTHLGAPMSQWPGEYRLKTYIAVFVDDSWKTAHESNTIALMNTEDAKRYGDIFDRIATLNAHETVRNEAIDSLRSITMEDPDPSHLSPLQLTAAVDSMRKLLLVEYQIARDLDNLAYLHPELDLVVPSQDERQHIIPYLVTPHTESDNAAIKEAVKRRFLTEQNTK